MLTETSRIPPDVPDELSLAAELTRVNGDTVRITGDRQAFAKKLRVDLSDETICLLFGGIQGSHIAIKSDEKNVDIWTTHDWFETPLYYSIERDEIGIMITINDFFLIEQAPRTLGTRIIANMIFNAARIPELVSIHASATRFFTAPDSDTIREVNGYYFFPRLGFSANPKNADDYIEIPERIKGKKLWYIMRNPELRQWWKANGQTIDVSFKVKSKRSIQALSAYLNEKGIGKNITHCMCVSRNGS
ncbi:MAG: hypothetical protein M1281_16025 [Chloroflexi bacterium]|nr:hypothetical protein [Chloroflexota bacterium]